MASDEDYMKFLDKANEDPGKGYASAQKSGGKDFKTTSEGVEVPAVLKTAAKDAFYSSDADEPFVPVALEAGGGGLPDEEQFASLIGHDDPSKAQVEIMDPFDWDVNGQYKDVIDAVTKASKGNDVRVYRIAKSSTKAEYWVITHDMSKILGLKALAVES